MRLIDGDALLTILENEREHHEKNGLQIRADGIVDAIMDVIDAPTIEPEREKGEWIPEFNGKFTGGTYWFGCSKCKRIVPEVRNGGWNYCPNCGAGMSGGEQ